MGLLEANPGPGAPFLATGRIVHNDTLVAIAGDEVSMSRAVALGLINDDQAVAIVVEALAAALAPPGPAGDVVTAVTPNIADLSEKQILEEVDGDPARAATALEAEKAGRRRKGVVGQLEKIIAAAAADDEPAGDDEPPAEPPADDEPPAPDEANDDEPAGDDEPADQDEEN